MLVITRKKEQAIYLDNKVCVQVIRIGSNTVDLRIGAPDDVKIVRSEIVAKQMDMRDVTNDELFQAYLDSM